MKLIQELKEIKNRKKITDKELGEMVGMERPNITRIWNGKSNPTLSTLDKICNALNVELIIKGK